MLFCCQGKKKHKMWHRYLCFSEVKFPGCIKEVINTFSNITHIFSMYLKCQIAVKNV